VACRGSPAELVREANLNVAEGDDEAGFAEITRARTGALGGAALIAFAALLATVDPRRTRPEYVEP